MKSQPKMTIEQLKDACPMVEIESSMEKITGRRKGVIVLQVKAAHVNSGTMRNFQAAYERARGAGLLA